MGDFLLLKQGNIHNAIEEEAMVADILISNGKITKIAPVLEGKIINEAKVIEVNGRDIYPGFVEAHCHLGLDGYAIGYAGQESNECNDCLTPELSAVDGINPMDFTFEQALKAGVTCVAAGPGSSNIIGGTFCALKTYGRRIDDMLVKEKVAMKCAFGENPKNCYQKSEIYTRMTIAAKLRAILRRAREYGRRREEPGGEDVPFDEKLEALLPVLSGEIPLKAHCHRADDMYTAIRIAREFDLRLTIDHCTDGSLIAEDLAKEGISCAVGPTFGHADKPELLHKSFETPGILAKAGCNVAIITDSPVIEQRYLCLCASMAVRHGMSEFDALKAITINAAKHVGIEDRVGSIETGKDADILIYEGNPFSSESVLRTVIVNGEVVKL